MRWDIHNHVVPPAALAALDDGYPIAVDGGDQLGRLRHARHVRPELADAPTDIESVLGRLVVDTITHDTAVLGALVDLMGPMAVALGTDLSFDMATPDPVGELLRAVGSDIAETIMRETGVRLFGLADTGA